MANSRVARFVMEVAPPQVISVMRNRTSKMLDTIAEEEKDGSGTETRLLSSKSYSSPSSSAAAAAVTSSSSSSYILKEVQRSFSICGH